MKPRSRCNKARRGNGVDGLMGVSLVRGVLCWQGNSKTTRAPNLFERFTHHHVPDVILPHLFLPGKTSRKPYYFLQVI